MSTIFFSIQFMMFYLRTAYGDSATFYGGGLSQHPFQGVCQGNGAGPAIWLVLSLCLVHMIHQSGSPTQISSAVLLTSIAMVCFIYVNDCNLFVLAPPSNLSPQGVLNTLQHNLDIWQGSVEATGGVLSLDKSSWSGVFYFFKAGQWKLHSSQSYLAILTICDGPQVLPLKRYEPDKVVKVVGVHQSLSGSMKAQITALTEKLDAWATTILQGHLDQRIFWQGLHTMIWPSLCYPLVVSSISEKVATGITKNCLRHCYLNLGPTNCTLWLCTSPPCTLWPWASKSILEARGCSPLLFLRSQKWLLG